MKKEFETESDEKKRQIMFFQATETQKNEEEVLMKQLATGEPAQRYSRIGETVRENAEKVVGAARIGRRPTFTPTGSKKKKASGSKKKNPVKSRQYRY